MQHRWTMGRLRRTLFALSIAGCSAVTLLYWRQQIHHHTPSALHSLYKNVTHHWDSQLLWTWTCRTKRCERLPVKESTGTIQSLSTCNMLCSSSLTWPQPTGPMTLSRIVVPVRADKFTLQLLKTPSNDVTRYIKDAFALLRNDLKTLERGHTTRNKHKDFGTLHHVIVRVAVNVDGDPRMTLSTNESYDLNWKPYGNSTLVINITAESFCGARHALETLSQLVWLDPIARCLLTLEAGSIKDAPRFGYRGLLLDTARNYFPASEIMRTIDAMGSTKLNTFHWHISDVQSFPFKLKSVPQLAQHGAYSSSAVYTTEEVRAIVQHARLRGVRVLIEVDVPAHIGHAWDWGSSSGKGHLAYCIETEHWKNYCEKPPCGQLNPRNPNVYEILEQVYAEIIQLTGVDDIFHIGGGEVSERCWADHFNKSDGAMELWFEFTQKAYQALERACGGTAPELTLLWSSGLTRSPYLEWLRKKFGVQVWGKSWWPESRVELDSGFRTIMSQENAWFLDCGFVSRRDIWEERCRRLVSWQEMYMHRPWAKDASQPLGKAQVWQIEGGEACQWTERLGPHGLDAQVWPRAAAVAERLWSDPTKVSGADVSLRLDAHRARLVAHGVCAAPLWPRWCTQNPHTCL